MTSAPDFVEAVVGYRAWHLDDDGLLRPWTYSGLPWAAGVNEAICARDHRHAPPVADCMCGLYALTYPADRRLNFRGDQAVGAVAAWGEMEVHRTGFRAQRACVVALALPDGVSDEYAMRLHRAAERHGVEIVAPRRLSEEACRHGSPLPEELIAPVAAAPWAAAASRTLPAVDPSGFAAPARGIAADAHLWVETALGSVVVGLTRQFAGVAAGGSLTLPEPGAAVAAGDRLATLTGPDGPLAVWAPVGGRVLAVNQRVERDPALALRDPEGAGWLVRLAPQDWDREAGAVTWGPAAARHYAACLARDAQRGDAFHDLRVERLRALPSVDSWGAVLRALRAERARPRYPDAGAVRRELGGAIDALLTADAGLRRRLGMLGLVVELRMREPEASLTLDLRGEARLASASPDLVLASTAVDAEALLRGTLDPVVALRCGDLRSSAPTTATLRVLAVLKHLRLPAAAPRGPSWAA